MSARSRLPFRQCRTLEGGGGDSLCDPEQPSPPEVVGVIRRTYSHARWIRSSAGSAPSWSRKISDQTVPVYLGA